MSKQSPCNDCKTVPEIQRGSGVYRDPDLIEKHCRMCVLFDLWMMNCISKLGEYENICKSTKVVRDKLNKGVY